MNRFFKSAAAALVGSVATNLVFLIMVRPFVIDPAMPLHALSIGPVAVFTAVGAVGAIIVYAILRAAMQQPDRLFVWVSVMALMASFFPGYQIIGQTNGKFAGGSLPAAITEGTMHVIAALIIVPALIRLWGARQPSASEP